jgi:hypothetical protein
MKMKKPVILLDEAAKEVGLAEMMFNLIRQNLEQKPEKRRPFHSLNGKVLIEVRDAKISVGLEFNRGKLTVSQGFPNQPDLHIMGDSETILELTLIKMKFGLPYFFDTNGKKILKKLINRELIIKGLLRNFIVLVKLTSIVSIA